MSASMKDYLNVSDRQHQRLEKLYADYRRLHTDPENCRPMIIIRTPEVDPPTWEQRLADPMVMLKSELDALRPHLEMEDDRVATVRVQFGTPQVASAFGCEVFVPTNNLPCAGTHVLADAQDVFSMPKPSVHAGWYPKLWQWTELWLKNLPEGVHIQHPDIQSPFNTAHLVRGNDILLDLYDCPDAVERLLDLVTDFMVDVVRHAKSMISRDDQWFFDWGALWKGFARMSNCSMHMISAEFYRQYVYPRDVRFLETVGGGRIHYCGTHASVLQDYFAIPCLSGLDVDAQYHDFFALCEQAPRHVTLLPSLPFAADSPEVKRLLSGDWPKKRNIIIQAAAANVEEGKRLLAKLRAASQC